MTLGMRTWGSFAFILGIATTSALAAPVVPKVSSVYTSMHWHICQTVVATPKDNFKHDPTGTVAAVTGVAGNWTAGSNHAGIISIAVGTVTFPAAAVSSGNATVNEIEVHGHAARFPSDPGNLSIARTAAGAQQGAFSLTATTAHFGGNVWDMTYGNLVSGTARTINLVRQPAASEFCIDAIQLTKQ
jgi:hypothetical protein